MSKHQIRIIFLLLFKVFININASTHWIVTENGRIQSQLDSPFHMRRPYDLLSFLDQDVRRTKIDVLYRDLVIRKSVIDNKWSGLEGATDIETRLYSQDNDCLKAGKLLGEIDLYTSIAADGSDRDGIRLIDFLIEDVTPDNSIVPDCQATIELDFSMFAFEHLAAMVNRANLTMTPEHMLLQWLRSGTTVASFGHQVALGLSKNNTSWLHHNLGAIYWRIQGDAYRAVECGRRAVHFAPREFRDIALLNLASIFHQARHPGEAAIILHAAVDHAPHQPVNHFALGNVYAILADYNRSIACYDNCLKLRPGLDQALTTKHAVICHRKLETGLTELHDALQGILSELHEYHSQQEQWLRLQERLMWEQAPLEAKLLSYTPETFSAVLANRGQTCTQRGKDSKLSCEVNSDSQMLAHNLQMDITLSLQMLLRNVESQAQKISEQMAKNAKRNTKIKNSDRIETSNVEKKPSAQMSADSAKIVSNPESSDRSFTKPVDRPKYSADTVLSWDNFEFDLPSWPSKEQCVQWKVANLNMDKTYNIFLPPENKGYRVSDILSTLIDLPGSNEHALPWYPPICQLSPAVLANQSNEKYFSANLMKQSGIVTQETDSQLVSHFKQYVNQGRSEEAEIGQRILTAVHKKIGPEWLLSTLSSLYWRIRSNNRNALDCLKLALHTVPKENRDVVLVSLASVMYEIGLTDEALRVAGEAFTVNKIEPSTNFLLALLHKIKHNYFGAIYHIKQTLRADFGFLNGETDLLLKKWSCDSMLKDSNNDGAEENEPMCSEKDKTISSEGILCSANEEQCKSAAIQCYRADRLSRNKNGDFVAVDSSSLSKIMFGSQCKERKVGLGQSLISTLLAANSENGDVGSGPEGSGNTEPDQSQLESLADGSNQQAFHMRISLGDDNTQTAGNSLGDFYVSVSLSDEQNPEALLHIYDKSGTYSISPRSCKDIKDAEWLLFTSMWQSIAARNIDIGPLLKPLPTSPPDDAVPKCDRKLESTLVDLEKLESATVRTRIVHAPEPSLAEWLALMAGDHTSSVKELGVRIAIALKENTTSWVLATAAAFYWRVIGNTEEAIICLRQAVIYAPNDYKDIPLSSLANVFHRIGLLNDALLVANMAFEYEPNFVVNHFTIGNIYTSLGDFEKAITLYRAALLLDPSFEPARNRLQAILCTLLFDESGSLRDTSDNVDN